MKKASAKLRKKVKVKFCREIKRLDSKLASYTKRFKSKN